MGKELGMSIGQARKLVWHLSHGTCQAALEADLLAEACANHFDFCASAARASSDCPRADRGERKDPSCGPVERPVLRVIQWMLHWGWLPGGMSSVWSLGSSHWDSTDSATPQKHRIPCATHSADAMQLEPHGSASAGTSSFAIQAHCFGRAIEHLRKVQLHERVQRLGGLDGRTLSRSDLD